MTRILNLLERHGYVERRPDSSDRRIFRIFLTERGKRVQEELIPIVTRHLEELLGGIPDPEQQTTLTSLKRIVANMAREPARIRREYGVPGGLAGRLLGYYARVKRQAEKLVLLGKCDLIPGRWILRKHMRDRTEFSSNIQLDKL